MCQLGARLQVLKNNMSIEGFENPYRQSFFFGITFGIKKTNVLFLWKKMAPAVGIEPTIQSHLKKIFTKTVHE